VIGDQLVKEMIFYLYSKLINDLIINTVIDNNIILEYDGVDNKMVFKILKKSILYWNNNNACIAL